MSSPDIPRSGSSCLLRSPADLYKRRNIGGNIEDIITALGDLYSNYYTAWRETAEKNTNVIFVKYEDILRNEWHERIDELDTVTELLPCDKFVKKKLRTL